MVDSNGVLLPGFRFAGVSVISPCSSCRERCLKPTISRHTLSPVPHESSKEVDHSNPACVCLVVPCVVDKSLHPGTPCRRTSSSSLWSGWMSTAPPGSSSPRLGHAVRPYCMNPQPYTLQPKSTNPTPYIPNLAPYTMHSTPHTLHPKPCTLHHALCTPHPTSQTLHPTPCTLHPTPYIPNLAPYTMHSTPHTRNPKPCTLHHALYTPHPKS